MHAFHSLNWSEIIVVYHRFSFLFLTRSMERSSFRYRIRNEMKILQSVIQNLCDLFQNLNVILPP